MWYCRKIVSNTTFKIAHVNIATKAFDEKGNHIASISFGMSDLDRKKVDRVDALMRDGLSVAKELLETQWAGKENVEHR